MEMEDLLYNVCLSYQNIVIVHEVLVFIVIFIFKMMDQFILDVCLLMNEKYII